MSRTFLVIVLIFLNGCTKANEPDTVFVDLTFISTNTPSIGIQGQDIISNVRCFGPDLCYKFSKFEITETTIGHFDIKAKSTYPNSKKGDVVCLQAIYNIDTSIKINAVTKGQYILRFLNFNGLFKSDTVRVN